MSTPSSLPGSFDRRDFVLLFILFISCFTCLSNGSQYGYDGKYRNHSLFIGHELGLGHANVFILFPDHNRHEFENAAESSRIALRPTWRIVDDSEFTQKMVSIGTHLGLGRAFVKLWIPVSSESVSLWSNDRNPTYVVEILPIGHQVGLEWSRMNRKVPSRMFTNPSVSIFRELSRTFAVRISNVNHSNDDRFLHVNAQWDDMPFSNPDDWVGVFPCRVDEPMDKCGAVNRYPTQYKLIRNLPSFNNVRFRILVRPGISSYIIAYVLQKYVTYPEVFATSSPIVVPVRMLQRQKQIRLSIVSGEPGAMRFVWSESPKIMPILKQDDFKKLYVLIGKEPRVYTIKKHPHRAYTYDSNDMCEPASMPAATVGFVPPGTQFEVIVHDIEPDTKYYYVIGNDNDNERDFIQRSFVAGPAPGAPASMIFFGDMGQTTPDVDGFEKSWDNSPHGEIGAPNTSRLLNTLIGPKYNATLINHIGDISYATGALVQWDNFLDLVSSVSSSVPYMTAMGNHELGWKKSMIPGLDSQGECGVPYSTFFPFASQEKLEVETVHLEPNFTSSVPLIRSKGWKMPWYSYDYGNTHVTIMSTEHDFRVNSSQYQWLEKDLRNVNRNRTPWLVFVGHRPMYDRGSTLGAVEIDMRKHVEPLLVHRKVDVAFWGHHHSYQRSFPQNGITHVVVGTGGFGFSEIGPDDDTMEFVNNTIWGVVLFNAVNATHSRLQFINNANDKVIDESWLVHS